MGEGRKVYCVSVLVLNAPSHAHKQPAAFRAIEASPFISTRKGVRGACAIGFVSECASTWRVVLGPSVGPVDLTLDHHSVETYTSKKKEKAEGNIVCVCVCVCVLDKCFDENSPSNERGGESTVCACV